MQVTKDGEHISVEWVCPRFKYPVTLERCRSSDVEACWWSVARFACGFSLLHILQTTENMHHQQGEEKAAAAKIQAMRKQVLGKASLSIEHQLMAKEMERIKETVLQCKLLHL